MRSGGRSALLSSSVHDATAPNDSVGRKSKPWAEGQRLPNNRMEGSPWRYQPKHSRWTYWSRC
jgi:hypothetical protein